MIAWRSRGQKVVSLSSSEAEFYACAEAVREVPFIAQILLFLGIPLRLPVEVLVDNIGAIFMTQNATSSDRTRHMDVRYRFVEGMQNDGLVKVIFVPTARNLADGNTKNIPGMILEAHQPEFLMEKGDLEEAAPSKLAELNTQGEKGDGAGGPKVDG